MTPSIDETLRAGLDRRQLGVAAAAVLIVASHPAAAQEVGLVTHPSAHPVRVTLDRFAAAVREANWVVFTEIDHAAAAEAVGMTLRPRIVVFFGNPRAGTGAMASNPTLALDLPMRVLVWQDDAGQTQVTRSTGEDIATRVFARHGIAMPPEARQATDAFLDTLVRKAAG
ncbi:DUF302 domain-containing protein [Neoroseomonas lacus]|uniref:DUF302 domain-containing protein n=1 Tax=Neoroseomonas lacus TaxID=287609 RepID=A0A917NHV5_9PROT|nr:DUF302 domain-containing protein [Neoroseomonas lacus]GGJ01705.1 hypothetical protein GCM10011320_05660 [Neoroseomonas lacus]